MATSQLSEVLQHLRRAVLLREGAGLTDGQLLEDYLSRRDEAALAVLVRRHGPMVWGVCRRVLRCYHDAEDAFQATFLVLVRKAASLGSPELLANWLYGVAHQTALKARATTAKRRTRERQVTEMPEPAVTKQDHWDDLRPLLDWELSRLSDKYRVALVLCDLEGKTRKEAARQLGVPEGTLAARLARGRVMLAKRLARHGLPVSVGALATVLAQSAASASVPPSLLASAVQIVSLVGTGQTRTAGLISVQVAALTQAVVRSMWLSKIQAAVSVLLMMGVLATGGIAWEHGAGSATGREGQEARALEQADKPASQRQPASRPEANKPAPAAAKAEVAAIEEVKNDRLRITMIAAQLEAEVDGGGAYLAGRVFLQMEVANLTENPVTLTLPSLKILGEGATQGELLWFQPEVRPLENATPHAETWNRELRARENRTIGFSYRKTDRKADQGLVPGKEVQLELTFNQGVGDGLKLLTKKMTIASTPRE